jgi:hypothetical protein
VREQRAETTAFPLLPTRDRAAARTTVRLSETATRSLGETGRAAAPLRERRRASRLLHTSYAATCMLTSLAGHGELSPTVNGDYTTSKV